MSEKTDIVERLLEIVAPREEQVCGGEGVKPVWGVWRHRDEKLIREIAQEIKAELSAAAATIERLEAEVKKLRQRLLRAEPDPMRSVEQGNAAECLKRDVGL